MPDEKKEDAMKRETLVKSPKKALYDRLVAAKDIDPDVLPYTVWLKEQEASKNGGAF